MQFYWNLDARTYVLMLGTFVRDHNDGHTFRPGMLPYCLLNTAYKFGLHLLSWSKIWREVVKYEAKQRVGDVNGVLCRVRWHNRVVFMISSEKKSTIFLPVPEF